MNAVEGQRPGIAAYGSDNLSSMPMPKTIKGGDALDFVIDPESDARSATSTRAPRTAPPDRVR